MKVDLDYIYTISDNDREFIKDMLTTFVKITPGSIDGINQALENNNWKEISRITHKIKPSILLLGIDEFSALIRDIENATKNNPDRAVIEKKVGLLNQYSMEVLSDIDELLSTETY